MNFLEEILLNADVMSNRNQQVWYKYQYKHDHKFNKLIKGKTIQKYFLHNSVYSILHYHLQYAFKIGQRDYSCHS